MPGQERIEDIIDIPAAKRQFDQLMEMLNIADAKIKEVGKINLSVGNGGGLTEYKKQTDELVGANKQMVTVQQQLQTEIKKRTILESELALELAKQREINMQKQKDIKQEAQDAVGLTDAYKKLSREYNEAARAAKNLSVELGENSTKAKDASAKALELGNRLKAIDASVGQHVRNVGNYTGSIQILQKSLQEIKGKMDDFTKSGNTNGAEMQQLQTEHDLLTQVLEKNAQGFSSLTMEVRTNERALATMFAQGMKDTEAFDALQQATSKAKRELREFTENEKLMSSTAPALQASMVAAKGLAGTYAVGAGAAALFAEGDEKIQKEMAKLVAVMTVLQGLNELHELLEKRMAITKIFSAAGTGIQTAALAAYTWMTGAATAATIAFRTALISTGLGAILVLLSSFIGAMSDAKDATEGETGALRDYEQAIADVNEDLEMSNKLIASGSEKNKEKVKQRAGSEAEIAKITQQAIIDEIAAKKSANEKLTSLEDELSAEKDKLSGKTNEKSIKRLEEISKQEVNILKEKNKNVMGIFDDGIKLTNDVEKEKTRKADEGRKSQRAHAEATIVDLETSEIALKKVMSDEKTSYNERLAATESFYKLQEQIENKKTSGALSVPHITPGETEKIKAENKKALAELSSSKAEEEKKLFEQEKLRVLNNQYSLFRSGQERKMAFEQEVYSDDKRSMTERLLAYDEYTKNALKLSNAEYNLKAAQLKKGSQELENLSKEHENSEAVIVMKGIDERKRIVESALKAQLSDRKINIEIGASEAQQLALRKINADFKSGKTDATEYAKALKAIEDTIENTNYTQLSSALTKSIDDTKKAGGDIKGLQLELDNLTASHLKKQGADAISTEADKLAKKKEFIDQAVSYEKEAAGIVTAIAGAQHERIMNNIQDQMDANVVQKDAEIANINASSLSQQDKAAAMQIANNNYQIQQDILAKKKKDEQVKQAVFEKDMAMFQIVINTAAAVMKASPNVPMMIATGIMGAAELAIVAAKPIPKYFTGIKSAPGGWALTDELGPEKYIEPGGNTFMGNDHPTLRMIKPGTEIIPAHKVKADIAGSAYNFGNRDGSDITAKKLDNLTDAVNLQTSALSRAYGKQKAPTVIINNRGSWDRYISQNVIN